MAIRTAFLSEVEILGAAWNQWEPPVLVVAFQHKHGSAKFDGPKAAPLKYFRADGGEAEIVAAINEANKKLSAA